MCNNEISLSERKKLQFYPLGDIHIGSPQFNEEFLEFWKKTFLGSSSEKIIYLQGDLLDCATKRLGNSSYKQTMSVDEQVEYIIKFLKPLKKYIGGCVQGNHCFSENTEILTFNGWKYGSELLITDLVASVNVNNEIEYVPIDELISNYIEDEIYEYDSRGLSFSMTKKHRFINISNNEREINDLDSMGRKIEFDTLVAGVNNNNDLGVDENILKLYAWCLTDSHYDGNYIIFYQSGKEHKRIINILDNLNIQYKIKERNRDIKSICGTKLKKKPKINYEIKVRLDEIYNLPYDMPNSHTDIEDWLYNLSVDEFNIFLNELVFCDGTWATNNAGTLYGSLDDLNAYQLLCLHYGIRTKLKYVVRNDGKPNHYRLSFCKTHKIRYSRKNLKSVNYKGYIYCVTNKNNTIITRYKGTILISGNSARLKKEYDLDVLKLISDSLDIEYGNSLYHNYKINDIDYNIYATHGNKNSAQTHLMLGNVIRQTDHINCDLIMYGHCHKGANISLVQRDLNGFNRKSIVLTGHFLDYFDSYAEEMNLKPSPASFPVINVGYNCRTDVKYYNSDEEL